MKNLFASLPVHRPVWRHSCSSPLFALSLVTSLPKRLAVFALAVVLLLPCAAQAGETITYPGNGSLGDLTIGGSTYKESLAPSASSPSDNTVTVTGGTIGSSTDDDSGNVFGGYSVSTDVTNNRVIINDGTFGGGKSSGWVHGGFSSGAGNATGNSVTISGGTFGSGDSSASIYGGRSGSGIATGNSVTISGGTFGGTGQDSGWIYGGRSASGSATGNSVTINGGTFGGAGQSSGWVFGGNVNSGSGAVTGNSVTISGGTFGGAGQSSGGIFGGRSNASGAVTGNSVTISGGTFGGTFAGAGTDSGSIYGGYSQSGSATGNTVSILGSPVFGPQAALYGGHTAASGTGDVRTGNTLNLASQITVATAQNFENWNFTLKDTYAGVSGGTMLTTSSAAALGTAATVGIKIDTTSGHLNKNDAFTLINDFTGTYNALPATPIIHHGAGFLGIYAFNLAGTAGNALTATVDTSYLSGGYGNGNTYAITSGTYAVDGLAGGYADGTIASTATGNTLSLSGSPTFGAGTVLYGGYAASGVTGDVRTGNTLEVRSVGLSAKNVRNFQNFRFYLPATIKANDTMLTLSDAVDIRTPSGGAATTVGVGIVGGGSPLKIDDTVTLIKAAGGLQSDAGMTNTTTGMQGISKVYAFNLETTSDSLLARVTGSKPSEESVRKSPAEGKAASVTLVTQGADLAAGQGMGNARQAARAASASGAGMAGFGALSGGQSRYNTGSHVDLNSFSLMTGLARRLPMNGVEWLAGVFFEAGWGSYDSYNSTDAGAGISEIRGKGNSRYYGGGVLGRMDVTEGVARGLYTEATLRVGGLNSTYKSDDLNPALGQASYDTNATYYGAHLGLGYIWELNDKASLDLYGKYFWTHTTGTNVHILGDPVQFKAVDSHRTRLGARFGYAVNDYFTPYVGAAWDYEFDGKAHSVVAGVNAPAPSLKGSSGMGELGLTWKPAATSPLSVDFGVQGFVGMREGVGGNVQLKFEF